MAKKDKLPIKVRKAKMTEKTWTANIATVAKLATIVRKASVVKRPGSPKGLKKARLAKTFTMSEMPRFAKKASVANLARLTKTAKMVKEPENSIGESDENVLNCQSGQRCQ